MNDPEVAMSDVLAKSDLTAHAKALEAAGAAIALARVSEGWEWFLSRSFIRRVVATRRIKEDRLDSRRSVWHNVPPLSCAGSSIG